MGRVTVRGGSMVGGSQWGRVTVVVGEGSQIIVQ